MGDPKHEQLEKLLEIVKCNFVPYQPVKLVELFQGRRVLVERIVGELKTPARHVILFGDAGVGKTSVSGLIHFYAKWKDELFCEVECHSSSTFDTIFSEVLEKFGITHVPGDISVVKSAKIGLPMSGEISKQKKTNSKPISKTPTITPNFLVKHLGDRDVLIIIDEYNLVSDSTSHIALAEFIKQLSNSNSKTKVVVVGTSESTSKLLGGHKSLSRCVAGIHVRGLNRDELAEILTYGFNKVGVDCPLNISRKVVDLSDGYPHFTHIFGLKLCETAISRCRDPKNTNYEFSNSMRLEILDSDYPEALRKVLDSSEHSLKYGYFKAITIKESGANRYKMILNAMAYATQNEVSTDEILENIEALYGEEGMFKFQNIRNHLVKLTGDERERVLKKCHPKVYKFTNPMMRAFVRIELERMNQVDRNGELALPFLGDRKPKIKVCFSSYSSGPLTQSECESLASEFWE